MRRLRIGLIGAGVIGGTHSAVLRVIADVPGSGVELAAVADPDRGRQEEARRLYGYAEAYDSHVDLLLQAAVDAVFVCTPTRFHAEQVEMAARQGIHIFCEKPLAMSYAEGRRMLEASMAGGVRTQIGLVLRFSAVFAVLRDLLRDPQAGRPLAVVFRDDQCFPIRGVHDSPWRADPTLTAGGTLIEHGVHDLDIMTWLFGPISRIRAWERNFAGHTGIEDYMAIELEHEGGPRAQLINVWHNMIQRASNRRLEIFCENAFLATEADMCGEILYQLGDGPLQTISEEEVLERFAATQPAIPVELRQYLRVPYLLEDWAFLDALRHEAPPNPDLAVGLEAQRIAAAVYEAARTNREIEVAGYTPAPA